MPLCLLSKTYWSEVIDGFKPAIEESDTDDRPQLPTTSTNKVLLSKEKNLEIHSKEIPASSSLSSSSSNIANEVSKVNMHKDLSIRHLLTLAVGGAIGTGLFVNSGSALSTGGPASLVIDWVIMSTCLFTVINALGELAAAFPVVGGFNVYISRFVDPSLGFAINWNYMTQWLVLLPLELVAASITIKYWNTTINSDAWVAIFYFVITLANLLDVKSFGETEFVLSMVKILAIIGFSILGIVLDCGGGPHGSGYIGGRYWRNPGAFVGSQSGTKFKGLCSVFVTAAFSYSGMELVALSAAESRNPRYTIPKAAKRTFWLITCSYVCVLTLVGCLVPYNDPHLLNGSSSVDAASSPLVIAIENGGIKGLPSLMNAIILIAVVSVANSSVYACSRCMTSMARIGNLPRFFGRVDRKGRPLNAILATLIFGLLSFIAASDKQAVVFTWLSALSGLSTIFCWMGINLAHIRLRGAMAKQGVSLDELPFVSQSGVYGSWYGFIVLFLVLVASFWTSLFPLGGNGASAESFFEGYLSFPILVVFYVGHKVYYRRRRFVIPLEKVDVISNRKAVDLDARREELKLERERLRNSPFLKRFLNVWC